MKLSPISFNLNNQVRNNKIQNQSRLKPMASDSISFSAKIPYNVHNNASNNILSKFLEKNERNCYIYAGEFWKLDDKTIANLASKSDRATRKEFSTNRTIVSYAHDFGKIKQLLQFTQNDNEIIDILNTKIRTQDNYKSPYVERPLKSALSFHDLVETLEAMKHNQKKKELLFSSWMEEASIDYPKKETKRTKETIASRLKMQDFSLRDRSKDPSYGPCGHTPKVYPTPAQMLEDMSAFCNILMEIIQDDSTSDKEALRLIQEYKEFCNMADRFYFEELEKYFTKQIVLNED